MIIYFKNGTVVKTSDELDKVRRDSEGNLIGMDWTHKPGNSLYYIKLSEVQCIIDDIPTAQQQNALDPAAPEVSSAANETPGK